MLDNFSKERNIDEFCLNLPLFVSFALSFVLVWLQPLTGLSNSLTIIAILVMLISGGGCSLVLKKSLKKTALLSVDTNNLNFEVNGTEYYFSDLMPTYEISVNSSGKSLGFYNFTLYFKTNSSLSFALPPAVALSFVKNYLCKYAKPNAPVKICGNKF